ncbi:hypothetical protein ILYODFUR_001212 [Ilyodon furcidens]|uniref:Uncharacterized protein n=1 Tax=Ilyodon furcidens TaxID=33524 RepID=A0ABV0TS68_9TELE
MIRSQRVKSSRRSCRTCFFRMFVNVSCRDQRVAEMWDCGSLAYVTIEGLGGQSAHSCSSRASCMYSTFGGLFLRQNNRDRNNAPQLSLAACEHINKKKI